MVEICRGITKHHYLVTRTEDVARVMKEAFHIATTGRPGPVLVDVPKDVQFALGSYIGPRDIKHKTYRPRKTGEPSAVAAAVVARTNVAATNKITALVAIDANRHVEGVIHLHDLWKTEMV